MYDLNLSWMALRQQQEWLLRLNPSPESEGLLSLIAALQGQGVKQFGEMLVYGKEEGKK
jgi:hypothetical protein